MMNFNSWWDVLFALLCAAVPLGIGFIAIHPGAHWARLDRLNSGAQGDNGMPQADDPIGQAAPVAYARDHRTPSERAQDAREDSTRRIHDAFERARAGGTNSPRQARAAAWAEAHPDEYKRMREIWERSNGNG